MQGVFGRGCACAHGPNITSRSVSLRPPPPHSRIKEIIGAVLIMKKVRVQTKGLVAVVLWLGVTVRILFYRDSLRSSCRFGMFVLQREVTSVSLAVETGM